MNENRWRKSTYSSSSNGGNSVEVDGHDHRVIVRDTNDRTGPVLRFTPAAWRNLPARRSGRYRPTHPTPPMPIGSLPVSAIEMAASDNTVWLRDVGTRTCLATLTGRQAPVASVAFSPDGTALASSHGKTVRLWQLT